MPGAMDDLQARWQLDRTITSDLDSPLLGSFVDCIAIQLLWIVQLMHFYL